MSPVSLGALRRFLLLLGLLPTLACSAPTPRGFLLLSIDTLRADALEPYGSRRPTSPFLRELASEATLFENAFCPLPGTLPSHMSMLTGLYPEEHGVFPPDGVLSPEIPLLAELFREAGFRTFGSTEGGYVHGGYGFSRGFDEFSDEARHKEDDIERTLARTLEFFRSLDKSERYFAFVHSYVVHDPYFPPEPYASQFWDRAPITSLPTLTGPNLVDLNRSGRSLTPVELEYLHARYLAQVRYLDDRLRRFFDELERLRLLEDLVVVVTSDHGEEFGEHGKLLHTQLYRECLQVPLIIRDPRLRDARRVSAIAETVDLPRTLLELAGLSQPSGLSGESLVPWIFGDGPVGRSSSGAYAVTGDLRARSLIASANDGLRQLLRFDPFVSGGHVYFADQFRFDHLEDELRIGVASLGRPRTLAVQIDDRAPVLESIGSGNDGRTLIYELDRSRYRHVVRLAGNGCRDAQGRTVAGCNLFQLAGSDFRRYELYDLDRDPRQARDLSGFDRRSFVALRTALERLNLGPRGTPGSLDDPELRKRLQALGYLR